MALRIDVDDGKYTVIQHDLGGVEILRHGQSWLDGNAIKGVNCLMAMAYEIEELRKIKQAIVRISVNEYFTGRLEGFTERVDADDDEHPSHEITMSDAYELLASVIEPIVQAEDRERG